MPREPTPLLIDGCPACLADECHIDGHASSFTDPINVAPESVASSRGDLLACGTSGIADIYSLIIDIRTEYETVSYRLTIGGISIAQSLAFDAHIADRLQSSYDTYSSLVQVNSALTALALLVTVTGFVCLIVWTTRANIVSERAPIVHATRKYSRGMTIAWWSEMAVRGFG